MVKRTIDWNTIDLYVDSIIEQIRDKKIDTVLGLARGGMIPATILAYRLGNNNLQQLGVRTRDVEATQFYGNPALFGNVLVVDDINDSGKTFAEASKYLDYHFDRGEINDVIFSACSRRYNSKWERGIYGSIIENDDWLVYPWE
mgnify:FL=1|tara:strand:- start:24 stop:455 length:432 start_codon:yes stop_codon:yes gene_type:complete